MTRSVQLGAIYFHLDRDPNECPYCYLTIVPTYISSHSFKRSDNSKALVSLYSCPNTGCKHFFLAGHRFAMEKSPTQHSYVFEGLVRIPVRPSQIFPDSITSLSAQFVNVYQQAHAAEQHGLDQIAGLGYRKALEFLVKDYLIKQNSNAEVAIKKAPLGSCINDRITDPRIKEMAKRATWLGNDEAHYVRKWVDRDVQDMKIIIQLIVSMVEQEHLFNSYMQSMPA